MQVMVSILVLPCSTSVVTQKRGQKYMKGLCLVAHANSMNCHFVLLFANHYMLDVYLVHRFDFLYIYIYIKLIALHVLIFVQIYVYFICLFYSDFSWAYY